MTEEYNGKSRIIIEAVQKLGLPVIDANRCESCCHFGTVYWTVSDDDDNDKTISAPTCKAKHKLFVPCANYQERGEL